MTAIVALDTETTGLSLDDEVWEFAAIRRNEDGVEATMHLFIEHDVRRCQALPESFLADHQRRFPESDTHEWHPDVVTRLQAAEVIAALFADRPHIIGAVPNFDTERLALLLRRNGSEPGWHYHLIDVENLAVGYVRGRWENAEDRRGMDDPAGVLSLPWDSDELSRACGLEPPGDGERHTALGDARWALRLYDAIMGGRP